MQLHSYQEFAKAFIINRLKTVPGVGLWLDCGLGKTATTLHAIQTLRPKKTLIVAPLRVCYLVWRQEAEKWGIPLRFSLVHGSPKQRDLALNQDADVYLINHDGIPWLETTKFRADLVVIDEVTAFRNWSSKRMKSLRRLLLRLPKRITLTGTPVPNGLGDIFAQHYILDDGATLGAGISKFRSKYMMQGGFQNRQWFMRPEMVEPLKAELAPWYLHQSAMDHLDMPEVVRNEILVEMPKEAKDRYKTLEKEMVVELEGDDPVIAATGGSKYNLCRQFASGGIYDTMRSAVSIHDAKTDALEDLIDELNGKSLLIAYCFRHDYLRIKERFPKIPSIDGQVSQIETMKAIEGFKSGAIKQLAVQCQAMSHGIDGLQKVCNDICWYSPTDQPEIRSQLEARIWRQGVKGQVRIHYLLSKGTVDVGIKRVLDNKDACQRDVLSYLRHTLGGATSDREFDHFS